MALGAVFIIGASVILVGLPLDLASRPHLDALTVITFTVVAWLLGLALIIPTVWLVQRGLRGIPVVRIDAHGVVMGTDRRRDRYVDWVEVEAVDVSVRRGGGVSDQVVRFETNASTTGRERSTKWTIVNAASRALYGASFAISTTGLTASADEILAQVARYRPDALQPANGRDYGR